LVCREQDGGSHLTLVGDEFPDQGGAGGVEPFDRLVHQENLGAVDDRSGNISTPLLPGGQPAQPAIENVD